MHRAASPRLWVPSVSQGQSQALSGSVWNPCGLGPQSVVPGQQQGHLQGAYGNAEPASRSFESEPAF